MTDNIVKSVLSIIQLLKPEKTTGDVYVQSVKAIHQEATNLCSNKE